MLAPLCLFKIWKHDWILIEQTYIGKWVRNRLVNQTGSWYCLHLGLFPLGGVCFWALFKPRVPLLASYLLERAASLCLLLEVCPVQSRSGPLVSREARRRGLTVWWVQEGFLRMCPSTWGPKDGGGGVWGGRPLGRAWHMCKGPERGPFQHFIKPGWPEHSEGGEEVASLVSLAGESGWAWATLKI